ncbi:MAG: transaldolase family protein [Thermoproteota archaeon]
MDDIRNPSVDVQSVVFETDTKELKFPIQSLSHADHIMRTALLGYPQLAADHILNKYMIGRLVSIVGDVIRRLNIEFHKSKINLGDSQELLKEKIKIRQWSYEVLIEMALNLIGIESKMVGFTEGEVSAALKYIISTLEEWEELELHEGRDVESKIAKAVVKKLILEMKRVESGNSMLSKIAEDLEAQLSDGRFAASFVINSKRAIHENVYYKLSVEGLCKFGNDYALGLRWLRHLGFVQVSTNPVLAARAYDDDPKLWNRFKEIALGHTEWLSAPEMFADDIAMEATIVALWPNLAVFRPIALLSDFNDGLVSYQLNPNVAGSLEGSIKDALRIYSSAHEFLKEYDSYLMWGYPLVENIGRPNIVFKVACENPIAVDVTTALNELGMGTNNTVTFSVSQEVTLAIAAMRGMAKARRMGIPVTKVYVTNMGGRLESHLREIEAERLLKEALRGNRMKDELLLALANELGALDEFKKASSFEERVKVVCSSKYIRSLTDNRFLKTMIATKGETSKEKILNSLMQLEEAIGCAGTLVAQRVYKIFFTFGNREKWVKYLQEEFALSADEAEGILDKVDLLPASKRKPNDTFLTLSRRNVTNTEFPNHQLSVLLTSRQKNFDFHEFEDSILRELDLKINQNLLEIPDFRKAYELSPEIIEKLRAIGIECDFGDLGLRHEEWPTFGPVVKTMSEFRNAYVKFKCSAIDLVQKSKQVLD